MTAKHFQAAALLMTTALMTASCERPSAETYALRWQDGETLKGLSGVRACINAFSQAILNGSKPDAVCTPDGPGWRDNGTIVRVQPIEFISSRKGPGGTPLTGKIAVQTVVWDSLPPWARGAEYTMKMPR